MFSFLLDGRFVPTQFEAVHVTTEQTICATNDIVTGSPGQTLTIDPTSNDGFESVYLAITNDPANGTLQVGGERGSVIYTPSTGFAGQDSFTYYTCAGDGFCSTAVVEIDLTAGCDITGDGTPSIRGTSSSPVTGMTRSKPNKATTRSGRLAAPTKSKPALVMTASTEDQEPTNSKAKKASIAATPEKN